MASWADGPSPGWREGWLGGVHRDAEKHLKRSAVVPGCLASASEQTKSGYKAKMVRLLWQQEFCLLYFLFPQQKFQLLSHLCLPGLCSNCCSFPAMSKGGSFHSIYVKQISVAFRGCLWPVVTGCISYHNPHREENRNGLQIITEEPQIALQSTLELMKFQVGLMVILYVQIYLLNRWKKSSCFRETSVLVEYQLHMYMT